MRGFEGLAEVNQLVGVPDALERAAVLRDALQEQGLPFDRRLFELGKALPERFGLGVEEFEFPRLEVLGLPRADWFHRAHRVESEWAHSFDTRIWLGGERKANHEAVEAVLVDRFGEPERSALGDRRRSAWQGLTSVRVTSYVREAEPGSNSRLKNNLELMEAVEVEIYSPIPRSRPDPDAVLQRRAARTIDVGVQGAKSDRRYLMLHPGALEEHEQGLWVDDGHLGYSLEHCSLVWPRTKPLELVLTEVRAARGGLGSATLSITCGSGLAGLLGSPRTEGLRGRAAELAERLALPLSTVAYDND